MKTKLILLCSVVCALLTSCFPPNSSFPGSSLYGQKSYLYGFDQSGRNPILHNGQMSPTGYWDGDGVSGAPRIRINRHDQRAYYYKGDTLVAVSPISTGTDGHTTPAGSFKVVEKNPDHKSSLYGVIKDRRTGQVVNKDADTRIHRAGPGQYFELAPMKHFMRFNGAIGMHAGFLPGYPASHGCIRMPEEMAKKFFMNTPLGTPVVVE